MNFLFLTQSGNLLVFFEIARIYGQDLPSSRIGFYISHSSHFDLFKKSHPEIVSGEFELLKEWEILQKAHKTRPNTEKLANYEKRLGDPVLWNAVVADRRLIFGKNSSLHQDYASNYSHEELLAILQVGIEEIEALFDRLRPDCVMGYVCVTVGEYLCYLVARARGIPFVNLRPTRIENYYHAADHASEPSSSTQRAYDSFLRGIPDELQEKVDAYLKRVREKHAMYDGVMPVQTTKPESNFMARFIKKARGKISKIGHILAEVHAHHFGANRLDNHYQGFLYRSWHTGIKIPLRKWRINRSLKNRYISPEALQQTSYTFFPLHKEPEVTMLIYSRPYLNQIEAIRLIARSLPVGMKLVVKEHPAAVGYRALSYYEKILEIPNVILAPPQMTSRDVVINSKLVAVIGGSIALEAVVLNKPTVALGKAPFVFLPPTMLRKIADPDFLDVEIHDLLENFQYSEKAIRAYVAAVMETSVSVNFYSELLGKGGYTMTRASESEAKRKETEFRKLAAYLLSMARSYSSTSNTGLNRKHG